MLKRFFLWYFKRRSFRLFRTNIFTPIPTRKSRFPKFKRFRYHFAGQDAYHYELPAKRHYLGFLLILLTLASIFLWFIIESYKGWAIFNV